MKSIRASIFMLIGTVISVLMVFKLAEINFSGLLYLMPIILIIGYSISTVGLFITAKAILFEEKKDRIYLGAIIAFLGFGIATQSALPILFMLLVIGWLEVRKKIGIE